MNVSESFTRTIVDCPDDTTYRSKETERILIVEGTADDRQNLDINPKIYYQTTRCPGRI